MIPYRVEFRAAPDTPKEEEQARKQGRTLGHQTVVYPCVYADSPDEAVERAVAYESAFNYRKQIWLFEEPLPVGDNTLPKFLMKLVFERE